jgi:protocatechuate 3,4-dioxygenase beta subunit
MKKSKISQINEKPTPAAEEGPYYTAGSPLKSQISQEGIPGERLDLSGRVLNADGHPVSHAWLDFWQADGSGHYDNVGFKLRGHQYSDSEGRYKLGTVLPGSYPGRTPHIHSKVRATNNSPILTTQLFIPGLESNKTDPIYLDTLQMSVRETPSGKTATFDFRLSD